MSDDSVDRARKEVLTAKLREAGALAPDLEIKQVRQILGGWSRSSFIATVDPEADGPERYVVRARPSGGLLDTDLAMEYRIYDHLQDTSVPVPAPYVFVEASDNPFGGPYFVMEHVEGTVPNVFRTGDRRWLAENWNSSSQIAKDIVAHLADIHSIDEDSWIRSLPRYEFEGWIERWEEIYRHQRRVRDPIIEELFRWVLDNKPSEHFTGLVHADYRPGNMILADSGVKAVLDWELAHVGDVRFDLGYLSLQRIAGRHLAPLEKPDWIGSVAPERWFFEEYSARSKFCIAPDDVRVFRGAAILMLATIMLTGVKHYADGNTTDVRMAWNHYSMAGLRVEAIELMRW